MYQSGRPNVLATIFPNALQLGLAEPFKAFFALAFVLAPDHIDDGERDDRRHRKGQEKPFAATQPEAKRL